MGYEETQEFYWNDRISNKKRYSSVGKQSLPNIINKYRREETFKTIEDACEQHDLSLADSAVLDAGCGTGIYSEFYAGKGADVVGVDLSTAAIREIREYGLSGTYLQSDLSSLPFTDADFDLTHCFAVLYHIVDDARWRESIAELDRVTRPGGYVFLRIEWIDKSNRPGDHVKFRKKAAFIHEFCEKRSYTLKGVYSLNDALKYESVIDTASTIIPNRILEAAGKRIEPTKLFKEHSEQKVVVFRKDR